MGEDDKKSNVISPESPDSKATKKQLTDWIEAVAKAQNIPKVAKEESTNGMTPKEVKSIRKSLMNFIPVFKGVESYLKVNEFIFRCEEYFKYCKFNDRAKFLFAESCFEQTAALWWRSVVDEVSKGTIVEFTEVFLKRLVQPEMLRIAISRLIKLAFTDSIVGYVKEFQAILLKCPNGR
jgi:hypothetical protein